MSRIPSDRCRVPQAFWRAVERLGIAPPTLLRQARLPASLHLEEQLFFSTSQYFSVWKALETLLPGPGFGFRMVTETDTSVHPPSSLAAFYARDYRDGLSRMARFKHLCTPEQLRLEEANGECAITIEWPYASEPEPSSLTDIAFSSIVELGRRATGKDIAPLRVDLAYSATDIHRSYFRCEVRAGMTQNILVLRSSDLDRPFPGHNPEMLDILTPALSSSLNELRAGTSIRDQVKTVLRRSLASGRPELSEVAYELNMSERTLQRRVTDESTTFRDLLVEARQELGHQLLSDSSMEIGEVAFLLGYQDLSSFYRAFRTWEGVTPNQWREARVSP